MVSDADARDGKDTGHMHIGHFWMGRDTNTKCGRKCVIAEENHLLGTCASARGEWVEPDVKENNKNREGCAPAKQLGTCTLYTHLYNSRGRMYTVQTGPLQEHPRLGWLIVRLTHMTCSVFQSSLKGWTIY